MKNSMFLLLIMMVFSSIDSLPFVGANVIDVILEPLPDMGVISFGEPIKFVFGANFSNVESSLAILLIEYPSDGFTYNSFLATMDEVDLSDQFGFSCDSGTLILNCSSVSPANGVLRLEVSFKAGNLEGDYVFDWRFIFTAFQQPPNPPVLVDRMGKTQVRVEGVFMDIVINATWNEDSDTLNVEASASCKVCGVVKSGKAVYQIFTYNSVNTGISDLMVFNGKTGSWEAIDVDTSSLRSGPYFIIIQITDSNEHIGTKRTDFQKSRTSIITIETEGLPSEFHETHLCVNGKDRGLPYLWDGQSRQLIFDFGETIEIGVDEYVVGDAGTRYYCENNSWKIDAFGDQTHTFTYSPQYLLSINTNLGEVSAKPETQDGYYFAGQTLIILAELQTEGKEEKYIWSGWRGVGKGSYTGLDNPASIKIENPINETAIWIAIIAIHKEMVPANKTDYIIDATGTDTKVTINSKVPFNITILRLKENPHPEVLPPPNSLPSVVDISVDDPHAIEWPIYIERTYTEADVVGINESRLGLYYFKDGSWHNCHKTGVDTGLDIVWANMYEEDITGSPTIIGELYAAAKFEPSDLSINPSTIKPGEEVTISVNVANLGEVSGNYTVILKINDLTEDDETLFLNGKASTRISFTAIKTVVGTYSVEIDGLLGNFTVAEPSSSPAPAKFEISNLEVTPDTVNPSEEVSISLTVKNIGEESGSYIVKIEVDEDIVDSKTVILSGGESTKISFIASSTSEGSHMIEVNGLTGSFNVLKHGQPQIISPLLYIGFAIIIVIIVVYFVYLKR